MNKDRAGVVMVLTGNGKGKTTSALGQALRAIGHGRKVLMLQFLKGSGTGEIESALKYLPDLTIKPCGRAGLTNLSTPSQEEIQQARKGCKMALEAVMGEEYGMVILDEINVALHYNLIDLEDVLTVIKAKRHDLDLVLTGRYAHDDIIAAADIVSEINEIKHDVRCGAHARAGIEY